jgi:hypothetical protein
VGLLLGIERVLDGHSHRALEKHDLARAAGAHTAGTVD